MQSQCKQRVCVVSSSVKLTPWCHSITTMRLKFSPDHLFGSFQGIKGPDLHEFSHKYLKWDKQEKGNLPSCLSMSSFEPPSMATGVTRPPSHFPTSLYQLRTRLEGETTMALSISGLASGLWRSSVHMRVIHCKVFPRPISSAMMQPYDPEIRLPVTHSHRNFTPSRNKGHPFLIDEKKKLNYYRPTAIKTVRSD